MLVNFSKNSCDVKIDGVDLTDWGKTDPPFSIEAIDDKGQLITGLGGGAVAYVSPQRWRLTINLLPGSLNSKDISEKVSQGMVGIKANYDNLLSGEHGEFDEGMHIGRGATGRGGPGLTDDQFVFEFNKGDLING